MHKNIETETADYVIEHGGGIRASAKKFGIPASEWLDLSTGINPNTWPVPPLPEDCWQRLPERNDGLEKSIVSYYGVSGLPIAGSQVAIQWLPQLYGILHPVLSHGSSKGRVGVVSPGYAEHAGRWRMAGYEVVDVCPDELEQSIDTLDVLVVINPNNPTGHRWSPGTLLQWHKKLNARNGWLIVDEAFIDTAPDDSVVSETHRDGLIVLRSIGKFFGLAGIRFGVMFAQTHLLQLLGVKLGPWHISSPSRYIACLALNDRKWQKGMREKLAMDSVRLQELLMHYGLVSDEVTGLFQWIKTADASVIYESLARQGVLVRLFNEPASIRFGLPGEELEWQRLEVALDNMMDRDEFKKDVVMTGVKAG